MFTMRKKQRVEAEQRTPRTTGRSQMESKNLSAGQGWTEIVGSWTH